MSIKAASPVSIPLAALVVLSGCRTDPAGPLDVAARAEPPAAVMIGRWEHVRPTPGSSEPSLNAGLVVGFDIDSAAGTSFHGRVAFWFAGDVGVSTDAFGPVSGNVADAGRVTFVITTRDPLVSPIRVSSVLSGDRLAVESSWRGNEPGPFAVASAFVRSAHHALRPLPIRAPVAVREEGAPERRATSCPRPRSRSAARGGC